MIKQAIDRILALAAPNYHTEGVLTYADKELTLIEPPERAELSCSTLQGLIDVFESGFDGISARDLMCLIHDPFTVALSSKGLDNYGQRRVWARAIYPAQYVKQFRFGEWLNAESFIILARAGFQRVMIENDDGSFALDLDYVIKMASSISAEHAVQNDDDGITQRVAVRSGVALKAEANLRPRVTLAPYRTFAEIDQVLSTFVFRARVQNGESHLALFEADGGAWRIAAARALKEWLAENLDEEIPIIA